MADPTDPNDARGGKIAALWIGIPSVLAVLFMAHHPTMRTQGIAEAVASLNRMATINRVVHGGLIALLLAPLVGFAEMAARLGWRRPAVRAGAIAYVAGAAAHVAAALVNGFVVTRLAGAYADAAPEAIESLRPILRFCHEANQVLAQTGVVAMSIGILAWSAVLVLRGGAARIPGALGIAAGVLPAVALLAGVLTLDVRGMGLTVLAQAAWSLAVAAWLWRS